MSNKKHPYLTRVFWLDIQKNYKPNPSFSDNGNRTYKDMIDTIVSDTYCKDDFITK